MIRVLIADDHAIVRSGLKQILTDSGSMMVVAEAENGIEAVQKVRALEGGVDVVVLDISMPGTSGIDALKMIRDVAPKLPVLILSMYPEEQYAVRLIKSGASGYMTKETAPQELVDAIHKVAAGKKYISPSVAEMLAEEVGGGNSSLLHASLSDREYQILLKLASGKTVSGIADEMALSVKTISTYRSRILGKMRMKNNAELTHYVISHQLAE
ncbi:LuxR family transcriptional regulator [Sulfuricella sp. T08]|uniref:response regulator n=1 Tax=Sulfuricella sp. T08 TaxID=1632857 RepID=UPI0006179EB2|nr:response regulator transcription factor [Sulfuricella sp. T08]GAO37378.1 LuxR family transcriptional regulator [Sulfuricella sp. T08]